jgi:hypothetical protein
MTNIATEQQINKQMEEEPNPYRAEKKIQTKSGEGV